MEEKEEKKDEKKEEGKKLKLKLMKKTTKPSDNVEALPDKNLGETAQFIARRDAARKRIMGDVKGAFQKLREKRLQCEQEVSSDREDDSIGETAGNVKKNKRKRTMSGNVELDKGKDAPKENEPEANRRNTKRIRKEDVSKNKNSDLRKKSSEEDSHKENENEVGERRSKRYFDKKEALANNKESDLTKSSTKKGTTPRKKDEKEVFIKGKKEKNNGKKKVVSKGKEDKGNVMDGSIKWLGIYSRTSPKQLHSGISKLTNPMRAIVRRMGFGKILTLKIDNIPQKLGHFVVDKLDTKRMVIVTEKGDIKVDKESLSLLLDIPEGGVDITTMEKPKKKSEVFKAWKKRYPPGAFPPSKVVSFIEANKYGEATNFFVLDFLLLFITTMIKAWKNGSCKPSLLAFWDDEREVKDYDWCDYILSSIKCCKEGWVRDDKDSPFIGPLTILTLLYVDSTICDGLKYEAKGNALEFWTSNKLKEREETEINNGGFGKLDIKDMVVDLTNYGDDSHEVKIVKEKQANIEKDLSEYFDDGSLKGHLYLIESMLGFVKKDKENLEKALRNAVRKFQNNKGVRSYVAEYKRIFKDCVNLDIVDGEEVEDDTDEGDDDDEEDDDEEEEDDDKDGEDDDEGSNGDDSGGDEESDDEEGDIEKNGENDDDEVDGIDVEGGVDDQGGSDESNESIEQDGDEVDGDNQDGNDGDGNGAQIDDTIDSESIEKIVQELIPVIEVKTKEAVPSLFEEGRVVADLPKLIKESMVDMLNNDVACEFAMKTPSVSLNVQDDHQSGSLLVTPLRTVHPTDTPGPFTQSAIVLSEEVERSYASVKSIISEEVKSKISKLKLESKLKSLGDPSYSMGFTQDFETPPKKEKTASKLGSEKVGRRAKRLKKLPSILCSPYIDRKVDMKKCVTKAEKKVWDYMFAGSVDEVELKRLKSDPNYIPEDNAPPRTFNDSIFSNDHLGGIKLKSFLTLRTNEWVENDVIDAWASVLNFEENKRHPSSPMRLVFGTLFTDYIVGSTTESDFEMNKMLLQYLDKAAHGDNSLYNLKDVDVVMFPVLEDLHYYLVCFELKIPRILVIDNWDKSNVSLKNDALYANKSTVCKLKHVFMNYLMKVGHAKCNELNKVWPEKLEIGWTTTDNYKDCGVFLMRHMEMFCGSKGNMFSCGFPTKKEDVKKKINDLRRKYACKILTSEDNSFRRKVEWEAEDYYKMIKT
ncbi:hypothetical protein SSX86_031763 [Deinandra increscens subsp. villosa]|uniref:Ubiquitin-like protease family profile domain-containing protein n=1 Tax=Deinandra increscens subsp. villosa TaxID=3103831 RepID=A0AAP0C4J8_9ASTR